MLLIIAGPRPNTQAAMLPLLNDGHRVLATAHTLETLRSSAAMHRAEGLLIQGPVGPGPEALATTLRALDLPAAIVPPLGWDCAPLEAVALLLPDRTDWVTAARALRDHGPTPRPVPDNLLPPAELPAAPAAPPPDPQPAPDTLLLGATLGGAGATSLMLALGAAVAQGTARRVLVATLDPLAFTARLGMPPRSYGEPYRIAERLHAIVGPPDTWPAAYDLRLWKLGRSECAGDFLSRAAVLLVTRPTAYGRLATLQLWNLVRQAGGTVPHVALVAPGTLAPEDFARRCADYGARYAWSVLPHAVAVPEEEERHGHALAAPHYGAAVTALARTLWPAWDWAPAPEEAPARTAHADRPQRRIQLPFQIEFTE